MEKLKIFFKSKTWQTIWGTLKLLISIPIFCLSVFFIYLFIFSSNNKKFDLAENTQGSYYSDFTFNRLLKSEPKNSKFWWESSVAYNKNGDIEEGMKRLNTAISLSPIDRLGYSGWIKHTKLKDYKNALKDFHRLDKLSNITEYPWGENIYFQMGICYQGLNNYDSAIIYYDKFITSENNTDNIYPRMYTYRGKIETERGNYEKAIDFYNITIILDKNIAEAYYYKAETFNKLNNNDSAKLNYQKSLSLVRKNYKNKDIYDEVFLEIYASEIEEKLNNFN